MVKDTSFTQTIAAAVITTGLTLLGTATLQKSQNDTAERTRFLDGAQVTAQATTKLLIQGYDALVELRDTSSKKGLDFYSNNSGKKFDEFYRGWRQQMIQNQFGVSRYFGDGLANQLIHVDEIDKSPVNNLSSPNPCSSPGEPDSFDINKMAVQVDCYIRVSSVLQDRLSSDEPSDKSDFFEIITRKSTLDSDIQRMIENYEVSYVKVLRSMDSAFTQLGGLKVKVVDKN